MKIRLLVVGKTDQPFVKEGFMEYEKRLKHYIQFETVVVLSPKNAASLSSPEVKNRESELLIKSITPTEFVVLLDESGKEFPSAGFANFLNQRFTSGIKILTFVIGGAFGVDDQMKKRANQTLALSKMTFSHQMVRLIFIEQLYRALTILNNESYHHV